MCSPSAPGCASASWHSAANRDASADGGSPSKMFASLIAETSLSPGGAAVSSTVTVPLALSRADVRPKGTSTGPPAASSSCTGSRHMPSGSSADA
eukprot:3285819-Prymnesium_polylepis.1